MLLLLDGMINSKKKHILTFTLENYCGISNFLFSILLIFPNVRGLLKNPDTVLPKQLNFGWREPLRNRTLLNHCVQSQLGGECLKILIYWG